MESISLIDLGFLRTNGANWRERLVSTRYAATIVVMALFTVVLEFDGGT
jgi:hypothetical protein